MVEGDRRPSRTAASGITRRTGCTRTPSSGTPTFRANDWDRHRGYLRRRRRDRAAARSRATPCGIRSSEGPARRPRSLDGDATSRPTHTRGSRIERRRGRDASETARSSGTRADGIRLVSATAGSRGTGRGERRRRRLGPAGRSADHHREPDHRERPGDPAVRGAAHRAVWDNVMNNTVNADLSLRGGYRSTRRRTPGPNIVGGPSIGGNFWAAPDGAGFSETHPDANGDGFCDEALVDRRRAPSTTSRSRCRLCWPCRAARAVPTSTRAATASTTTSTATAAGLHGCCPVLQPDDLDRGERADHGLRLQRQRPYRLRGRRLALQPPLREAVPPPFSAQKKPPP